MAVEVEEGWADADVVEGELGGGVSVAKIAIGVNDGIEGGLDVVEVAFVAGNVVYGFNTAVEHGLRVAAGEGDVLGDEGVRHPGGVWFDGIGRWEDGGEGRHSGESEEHFGGGVSEDGDEDGMGEEDSEKRKQLDLPIICHSDQSCDG